MGWIERLFARRAEAADPLYAAIVARARAPHWYLAGQVPDTIDGRFDMVAAVLSMVLLRLEAEEAGIGAGAEAAARLTERFVRDMDGQLREIGIGDIVVGKHIGRMMAMLGGRLGAYRAGLAAGDLRPALTRNLYRGHPPASPALAHVAERLTALAAALDATDLGHVLEGEWP